MAAWSIHERDESGSTEWLADVVRQEGGWDAVFFLLPLFKYTSLRYVRAGLIYTESLQPIILSTQSSVIEITFHYEGMGEFVCV